MFTQNNAPVRHSLRTLAAATGLVLGALPALGQDALGDGRGLQRQQPGLGVRLSDAPSLPGLQLRSHAFQRELAFRESIVTGSAPGGLAFRDGTLPSRFEFRGDLGGDDIFAFRRDSLYSGLSGRGIRGTEALQYQFSLITGQRPPANLAGPLSLQRGGGRTEWDLLDQGSIRQAGRPDAQLTIVTPEEPRFGAQPPPSGLTLPPAWDASSLTHPVRSTSQYAANRGLHPTMLTVVTDNFTRELTGVTASPLTGMQTHRLGAAPQMVAGIPIEVFLPPESAEPVRGVGAAPSTAVTPDRPQTTYARTAYEQVLERMTRRHAATAPPPTTPADPAAPPSAPPWIADLTRLRYDLHLPQAATMPARPEPVPPPEGEATDRIAEFIAPTPTAGAPAFRITFDPETLRTIRETGGRAETFIPAEARDRNIFTEHMQRGEELLADGRFFDAEERFISALAAKPGDVTALFGRLHAELGGGLVISAATNLRSLLFSNPEAAGMRWGPKLLPGPERTTLLKADLRALVEAGGTRAADAALLLAYIGFQSGDEGATHTALIRLRSSSDHADQRLATFLQAIWLGDIPERAVIPPPPPAEEQPPPEEDEDAG